MLQLSTENIISLYAPLTGVVALAFWSGVLTQKIADVVRRVLHLESREAGDTTMVKDIAVLQSDLTHVRTSQDSQARSISEIQRTLSNMVSGKSRITRFDQDDG